MFAFSPDLLFIIFTMCVHAHVCEHEWQCPQRPEELELNPSVAAVTDDCKLPRVVLRTKL